MKEPAHVAYDAYRDYQLSTGANAPEWGKLVQEEQGASRAAVAALFGGDPEPAPTGSKP